MSRYRKLGTWLWSNENFLSLSDSAHAVFLHVMTSQYSNAIGCYKASLEALASEARKPFQKFRKGFEELSEKGFVEYDEKFQIVLIPYFIYDNPPTSPNVLKSWLKTLAELPPSYLKSKYYQILANYIRHLPKTFRKVFESYSKELEKDLRNSDKRLVISDISDKRLVNNSSNNIAQSYGEHNSELLPDDATESKADSPTHTSNQKEKTSKEENQPDRENRSKEEDSDDPDRTEESDTSLTETSSDKQSKEEKIFITIPLIAKDGEYEVTEQEVEEFQELYPGIDVREELRKIRAWNLANPKRRKTRNGIRRHINTWLSRAQDRAKRYSAPEDDSPEAIARRMRERERQRQEEEQRRKQEEEKQEEKSSKEPEMKRCSNCGKLVPRHTLHRITGQCEECTERTRRRIEEMRRKREEEERKKQKQQEAQQTVVKKKKCAVCGRLLPEKFIDETGRCQACVFQNKQKVVSLAERSTKSL